MVVDRARRSFADLLGDGALVINAWKFTNVKSALFVDD
jgi:hypothetical protein